MSISERRMTVAHIREQTQGDAVEVMFLESARFYRLLKSKPDFSALLERLRAARQKGEPVEIAIASPGSDLIGDVKS
ncbi:MAG: hypothetical protein DME97_11985 [Verrucomicrobia bacterium]|nr:MAG: hypothetical protein DME97_11985 [Verrucomicrobiota bacterium]